MSQEKLNAKENVKMSVSTLGNASDSLKPKGTYHVTCHDSNGSLLWEEDINNVVCTAGKNLALDTILSGSAYTVTGPYMGLISSVSWSATAATDTMASHSGWTEAGSTNAPTFASRGTVAFSSASAGSKSTSSAVSFTMTGAGTLEGCFLVYGSGAVNTIGSTAGTLLSAGAFTSGSQVVSSGNVVTVSYMLSI